MFLTQPGAACVLSAGMAAPSHRKRMEAGLSLVSVLRALHAWTG